MEDAGSGAKDQNNVSAYPATDLSAWAKGKWYHRVIPIPSSGVGKSLFGPGLGVFWALEEMRAEVTMLPQRFEITNGGSRSSRSTRAVRATPSHRMRGIPSCAITAASRTRFSWRRPIFGATSQNYTALLAGIYAVTVTDANGCQNTSPGLAITLNTLPTATISGSGTVWRGKLQDDPGRSDGLGSLDVSWSDGVTQSNVTVSPATRSVSPASTTAYTVTSVTDLGTSPPCSNTGTGTATVTVLPLPTASVSGDAHDLCWWLHHHPSGAHRLRSVDVSWSDSVTQTGVATSPATRSVSPASTLTYTVASVTDLGTTPNCSNVGTGSATVTVLALPTATVSGTASICSGGSYNDPADLTGSGPWMSPGLTA